MARLSHPNVIAVYEVGTVGDQVFLAMEFVKGMTLASWQRERARVVRQAGVDVSRVAMVSSLPKPVVGEGPAAHVSRSVDAVGLVADARAHAQGPGNIAARFPFGLKICASREIRRSDSSRICCSRVEVSTALGRGSRSCSGTSLGSATSDVTTVLQCEQDGSFSRYAPSVACRFQAGRRYLLMTRGRDRVARWVTSDRRAARHRRAARARPRPPAAARRGPRAPRRRQPAPPGDPAPAATRRPARARPRLPAARPEPRAPGPAARPPTRTARRPAPRPRAARAPRRAPPRPPHPRATSRAGRPASRAGVGRRPARTGPRAARARAGGRAAPGTPRRARRPPG